MALLFCLFLVSLQGQREIQLKVPEPVSFEGWLLRLDTKQEIAFSPEGHVKVDLPADAVSFEIVDKQGHTRYFGVWSRHPEGQAIILNPTTTGVALHQVVSASRTQQNEWSVSGEIGVVRPDEQPERVIAQTSDWLKERAEIMLQKTNLGGGSPIMRGMSGNRVLLMVDGFRLNNAVFRLGLNQYLNTLPASQIDQIEILNGPSGVQHGSDGLGGTIHLRSGDPAVAEPGWTYDGSTSTADGTHTHEVSGSGNIDRLFYSIHGRINRYEDLRAADPAGDQVPTGYDAWDSGLQLSYQIDDSHYIKLINYLSDARNVPRTDRIQSGRDLLWEYHPQIFRMHGVRFESEKRYSWADHYDVGIAYMNQDEGTRRISRNSPDERIDDRTSVDTVQINGTFTKITRGIQWVYGFDSQKDQLSAGGETVFLADNHRETVPGKFPNDSTYSSVGLFGVVKAALTEDQALTLGLRQTWVTLKGTLAEPIGPVKQTPEQLTPSLAWSIDRDQYFFSLGASQGFRAPSLEDTLALGPSNAGFDAPNPGLEPESLWSYEANFRWRNERSLAQLSVYTSRFEDLIDRVPGSYLGQTEFQGEPVFILDNVGRAQVDGLSLKLHRKLNAHHQLVLDSSWTEGTQTDTDQPMTRIPPLRGNVSWLYETDRLQLTGSFSWADRQDRLSPGDLADSRIPPDGTPGYGVFHLRSRYKVNRYISINASLENLTDKLYKQHGSGIYEPGRRLLLNLQTRWL